MKHPPLPLSTSPRRPRLLHHQSPRTPHRTPALTLPPPPVAATYLASISLLIYLTTRPLLARLASLYLGTRVRLRTLHISPFRKRISLGGIQLSDPRGRPLVAVDDITVALRSPSESADEKATPNINPPPPSKRAVDITFAKPTVVALFDTYDFSESNWTLFVSNLNKRRGTTTTASQAPPKHPSTRPTRASSATEVTASQDRDVRISIVGGVRLSLRSALLNNERLIEDVILSNVTLSYSELRSPRGLAAFVDALAGRAVRSARARSFPAEFRSGARQYARRVLAEGLAKGIRVGREHVSKVRKRIDKVDEFVFSDLPDAGGVAEVVKTLRDTLRGVESFLGGDSSEEEKEEGGGTGGRQEAVDRGDVEYRELDEGEAEPTVAREREP